MYNKECWGKNKRKFTSAKETGSGVSGASEGKTTKGDGHSNIQGGRRVNIYIGIDEKRLAQQQKVTHC